MLTYNLIADKKGPSPSASGLVSQTQSLVEALSTRKTLEYPPGFLIYPLEHQYTARNLCLSGLKGVDLQRVRCLANSCDRHGESYLFLAQFDKLEIWDNCKGDESDVTDQRYLSHVCTLDGFELSTADVPVDETSLLKSISYDGRDPDSRFGGEYLGNEQPDLEETYSDTVSSLKPKQRNIKNITMLTMVVYCQVLLLIWEDSLHTALFDLSSPKKVFEGMMHLQAGINDSTETTLQKILDCLCRLIWDEKFAVKRNNDVYIGYASLTIAVRRSWPPFKEAWKKTLNISSWDNKTWSALGSLIDPQNLPNEVEE